MVYCQQNHGALLVGYTKRNAEKYAPICISGAQVEKVNSFRVLGITIIENLRYVGHHTPPPWLKEYRKALLPTET